MPFSCCEERMGEGGGWLQEWEEEVVASLVSLLDGLKTISWVVQG